MKTLRLLITSGFILMCAQADAQFGDCPGEIICSIQNRTLTAGSTNEINAANCGTLPPTEATYSYWYEICVSIDGTIAFAINPSGSGTNFDFAVWGPSSACPPATAPTRCSSSTTVLAGSNGDKVGVGQGALDLTENGSGDGWVAPIAAVAGECYTLCINRYTAGTNAFTIEFDGSATITCNPLPVTLTSLSWMPANDGIQLNWTCETEINCSHFIIERTTDGFSYEFIARIEGSGTTSQPTSYSYLDLTAPEGYSYYRLRQVDFNGAEKIYGPLSCEFTSAGPTAMEITNINGQVVFKGTTSNYNQTFIEQQLPPGVYVIILSAGNTRQTFKRAVLESDMTD